MKIILLLVALLGVCHAQTGGRGAAAYPAYEYSERSKACKCLGILAPGDHCIFDYRENRCRIAEGYDAEDYCAQWPSDQCDGKQRCCYSPIKMCVKFEYEDCPQRLPPMPAYNPYNNYYPPAQPRPVQPAPPAPVQPAPVQPAPVQPAPVQPAPVQPAPVQPAPAQPAPAQPAPAQPAPTANSGNSGASSSSGATPKPAATPVHPRFQKNLVLKVSCQNLPKASCSGKLADGRICIWHHKDFKCFAGATNSPSDMCAWWGEPKGCTDDQMCCWDREQYCDALDYEDCGVPFYPGVPTPQQPGAAGGVPPRYPYGYEAPEWEDLHPEPEYEGFYPRPNAGAGAGAQPAQPQPQPVPHFEQEPGEAPEFEYGEPMEHPEMEHPEMEHPEIEHPEFEHPEAGEHPEIPGLLKSSHEKEKSTAAPLDYRLIGAFGGIGLVTGVCVAFCVQKAFPSKSEGSIDMDRLI